MSHSPSETDIIEDRRSKVWELRLKGYSIREVGKRLGITKSTAHNDIEAVRQEVADDTKEAALKYREIELGRLDELYRQGYEQLISLGDISQLTDADSGDEKPRLKLDTIAPLLNALKGISERRAKLLGLDGPVEFKGSIEGEVTPESIRLAIAAEFSSRAAPKDTNDSSAAPEPESSDSASGD